MYIGADAMVDLAPPPQVRAPDRVHANASEPSFDDHLDAAAPTENPESETQELDNGDTSDAPEPADQQESGLAAAPTPGPPPQSAQLALIQILASFAAADSTPNAEAAAVQEQESAPPAPANAAATPLPPSQQPKLAQGDKAQLDGAASAPAPAPLSGDDAFDPVPQNQTGVQPPQAPAPSPQAPAPAVQSATADGAMTAQTAAPILMPPAANGQPPPVSNAAHRANAPSDAPNASPALGGAGPADLSASAKPVAQAKAAPPAPASATAPPRDNFASLLAQHEAPQPASAPPPSASGLYGSHAAPATISTDSAAPIATAAVQVSREIVRRFNGESTRFELRLDPPELGRVEVRLEVSRDHRVTVVVGADSPQALVELSRHARELEQALQSAGLELTEDGLSFDLSDRSHDPDDSAPAQSAAAPESVDAAIETGAAQSSARLLGLQSWRGVRVDLVA